jgi:hypothetical protein
MPFCDLKVGSKLRFGPDPHPPMNLLKTKSTLPLLRPIRLFSSSSTSHSDTPTPLRKYPKHHRRTAQDEEDTQWDLEDVEEEDERHMSGYGWDLHRQQREFFVLMRTLQRDADVLRGEESTFPP